MTKNITLAVDEDVLEKVRRVAAEENTTVNAMVRKFLGDIAGRSTVERERREAAGRLLELSRNSKARLGKGWKFDRGEIYAERLSRHEHTGLRGDGGE